MKKLFLFFFLVSTSLWAQKINKKPLDHEVYKFWKKIEKTQISNDGRWVSYQLTPGEGDATVMLRNLATHQELTFARGAEAQFSTDNQFLICKIKPFSDTLKAQRRRKVKDDALPKDTLCIYELAVKKILKIPNVKSYKIPEKWSGTIAFLREAEKEKKEKKEDKASEKKDSAVVKTVPRKKKDENKDNGYKLIVRELSSGTEKLYEYVKEYVFAEEGQRLAFISTGIDTNFRSGAYLFDCEKKQLQTLKETKKGNYKNISLSKSGTYTTFIADTDTTRAQIRPFDVFLFQNGTSAVQMIFTNKNPLLPKNWIMSENSTPTFSKDEKILYFSIAPPPIFQDTLALSEEIVNVEVWTYKDPRLYTQQNFQLEEDKKRRYLLAYNPQNQQLTSIITDDSLKQTRLGDDMNGDYVLVSDDLKYRLESSWLGFAYRDIFLKNVKTGELRKVYEKSSGIPNFSPQGKFVYWYQATDTSWLCYNIENQRLINLSKTVNAPLFDEQNDVPDHPDAYGMAAWTRNDDHILLYDRYDIWKVDPKGQTPSVNLTNARVKQTTYRYLSVDKEKRFIEPDESILLSYVDEKTKGEGYASLDLRSNLLKSIYYEPNSSLSQRVLKAKNAETYLFSKENFQTFPDILVCKNKDFSAAQKISNANPQQANYSWGNIELYEWTSLEGQHLRGLLVKPEGFDPTKKYPMIVNFYERSSQTLNTHRMPEPLRSSINYAFYASRGYLIFNPDVVYKEGYPGESATNCVISGVTSLIDKGFVDAERIGIQGHSWGGYQAAYLIGKTNIFRCAEAGAPVVNMTSAYGGIRWESGVVREFQYEKQQSRIGGTLWQYPMRYLENSPLFSLDKVKTPVLILHNDKDGAVPWYQGIEYFTGLRRLGKPAWLLNYNDEPHWPVKWQNRVDFNVRMQEFFDFYLKDAPQPNWMKRGVPALEKGIKKP